MRFGPPNEVLSGTCGWACRVASWRGGQLLAADVPVAGGRVVASVGQTTLEGLTLSVPRWDGRDWRPGDGDATHPLARFGQELQVSIVVSSSVTDHVWETRVGRFLITDWDDDDGGLVTVTAEGLLRRVADDKLTAPLQPLPGGTLMSEARRLMPLGMSAAFDPTLVDRACPAGMSWSEDRLVALQEIADAWPARLRTDEWGQVQFLAPLLDLPSPVLTFTDGQRGTLVSAPRSDTRKGAFNRVVARSSMTGVQDVQAIAETVSGPMAVSGPYGAVTRIWSSPLIGDLPQALASAETMRRRSVLPSRTLPVRAAADPRVVLDDPVEVIRGAGTPQESKDWGWVTGYDLPLTVADGDMRVDVGVAA